MQTEFKHLIFTKTITGKKTSRWQCVNKAGEILGEVAWYSPWRQYCFHTSSVSSLVFSSGCLDDIARFMRELRKAELEERETNDT